VLKRSVAERVQVEAAVHSKLERRVAAFPMSLTASSSDLEGHAAAMRAAARLDS
jgi:hypothetical protein